jgi:hypothetical protein
MPVKKQESDKNVKVYQLKVTLKDIRPPIWRRIQVKNNTPLNKLHDILQVVMGWDDYHLHQFTVQGRFYGVPDPEFLSDIEDEKKIKLKDIVTGERIKFRYEYDFGDGWLHDIVVEKILEPESGVHYPICLKGKYACPPEDCGGVWGYHNLLEIIKDPDHPEHEDMLEWVGEDYNPEAFDLDYINQQLSQIK